MPRINLLRIQTGDNQTSIVEKVNYNFDQILSAGGGPQGTRGDIGPTGPIGPQGPIGLPGLVGADGTRWFVQGTTAPLNPNTILGNNPNTAPNLGDYWFDTDTNDQKILIFGTTGSWIDTGYGFGQSDIFAYYKDVVIGSNLNQTGSAVLLNDLPTNRGQENTFLVLSDTQNGGTGYSVNSGSLTGANSNINNEEAKFKIATKSTSRFPSLISFGKSDLDILAGTNGFAYSRGNNPSIRWRTSSSYDLELNVPNSKFSILVGDTPGATEGIEINALKGDILIRSNSTGPSSDKGVIFQTAPSASGGFLQIGTGDTQGARTTVYVKTDHGVGILSPTINNPLYVNNGSGPGGTGGISVGSVAGGFDVTTAPTGGILSEGNVIIGATGHLVFPSGVPVMPAAGGGSQPSLTISRKSTGRVFEFRQDSSETIPLINPPTSTNSRIYFGNRDSTNGPTTNFGPNNLVQEFNASGSISTNITDASALSYIQRYANGSGANGGDVFSITTRWEQSIEPSQTVLKTGVSVGRLVLDFSPTSSTSSDHLDIRHRGQSFARFNGILGGTNLPGAGRYSLTLFDPSSTALANVLFPTPSADGTSPLRYGRPKLLVSLSGRGEMAEFRQDIKEPNSNFNYNSRITFNDTDSDGAPSLSYITINQEAIDTRSVLVPEAIGYHHKWGNTSGSATNTVFSLVTTKNQVSSGPDSTIIRTNGSNGKLLLHINPTSSSVNDQIGILHRGLTFAQFNGISGGTNISGSGRYSLVLFNPNTTAGNSNIIPFPPYIADNITQNTVLQLGAPKLLVSAGGRGELAEFRQDIDASTAPSDYNSRITFNDRNSSNSLYNSYTSINQEVIDTRAEAVPEAIGYHHKWGATASSPPQTVFSIVTTKTTSGAPDGTVIRTSGTNGILFINASPTIPSANNSLQLQVNGQANLTLYGTQTAGVNGVNGAAAKIRSGIQGGVGAGLVIGNGTGTNPPANTTFFGTFSANTYSLLKLIKTPGTGSGSNNGLHIQNDSIGATMGNPALIVSNGTRNSVPRVVIDGRGNLGIYDESTPIQAGVNANLDVYGSVSMMAKSLDQNIFRGFAINTTGSSISQGSSININYGTGTSQSLAVAPWNIPVGGTGPIPLGIGIFGLPSIIDSDYYVTITVDVLRNAFKPTNSIPISNFESLHQGTLNLTIEDNTNDILYNAKGAIPALLDTGSNVDQLSNAYNRLSGGFFLKKGTSSIRCFVGSGNRLPFYSATSPIPSTPYKGSFIVYFFLRKLGK
jgi:hypothetical protein